jgi:hypothetical protein
MKTNILLLSFALAFSSSCKKVECHPATVLRDCTGTYLKIGAKEYFVCNPGKIASYSENSIINVDYKLSEGCDDGQIHCEMLRLSDGRLLIKSVCCESPVAEQDE